MTSDVCNSKIRGGNTLSPNPYPSPPDRERGTDPLELIAEGRHSVEAVCRASKMSILELAEHVCTPRNLEALGRVAELHAIEQEMLLGKLKRNALMRLAELTDEVPSGSVDEVRAFEVMRRACRDLLRSGGSNTEKRSSRPGGPERSKVHSYHSEPLTPAFEAEVLEALERLGEEANQSEARAQKSWTAPTESHPAPTPSLDPDRYVIPSLSRHHVSIPKARSSSNHTDALGCGCHGQVPPARAFESPADPRAKSPLRPCPWHPPRKNVNTRTRTRRMPVPLYVRSTENRIMKGGRDMRFDDAHPP